MRKYPIILVIILTTTSITLASWWNPLTWFEKQDTNKVLVKPIDLGTSDKYWDKWVQDQLSELEASGKQFDRTDLIGVMLEANPIDNNGNYDFEEGYKILEKRNTNMVSNLLSGKPNKLYGK